MKNEEFQNKRMRYYSKVYVLFELIKAMRNREVVFMSRENNAHCIRGIYIKSVDYLKEIFNIFNFFKKDYNIYISTASYSELPSFTYNLMERSKQTSIFFQEQILNYVNGYDILLDFDKVDNDSYLDMFTQVLFIKTIFDKERVKYYLVPSGSNFQIVIPSDTLPFSRKFNNMMDIESFNYRCKVFVENIKERFNLKYLDLINNGVLNRVMKCPYSLVGDRVVLPLIQLKNFKYNSVEVNHVLKNVILKERKVYYFNDLSLDINKKNMAKFIKKYYLE